MLRRSGSLLLALAFLSGCEAARSSAPESVAPPKAPASNAAPTPSPRPSDAAAPAPAQAPSLVPTKVEMKEEAMGTSLHFIAYTSARADEAATRAAITQAIAEVRRLEALLSEWKQDSEIGQVNAKSGEWVEIGPESRAVIERGLWAGKLSAGSFDITFQALSKVWKFGSAQDAEPKPPTRAEVEPLRRLVDYRRVELDDGGGTGGGGGTARGRVRIGKGQQLGVGGIAKGYIIDAAAKVLRAAGVESFLAQAGGDLYGAGRKPGGEPWVSGVQDPRAPQGQFFAVLELTDHAFSTAGDYARSYVFGGKRYHHIIDPKTGFPATACRSVTVWAPDATTADGIDDAVFILGPKQGLKLVESLDGVGVVIVDASNQVFVSDRIKDKVKVLKPPTDAPN
jgi:thiamine biosynthesis lipoprotein